MVKPEDRHIHLQDILDDGYCPLDKSRCLLVSDSRPLTTGVKMYHRYTLGFTTPIFKRREHFEQCRNYYDEHFKGIGARNIHCTSDVFDGIRYPYRVERERLQTLPEGYCSMLSDKDAADVLGDGWTVDVIAHIFSFLKKGEV